MQWNFRTIALSAVTIGITATGIIVATQQIRKHFFGKGVGDKEATLADKQTREIIFTRA